MAKAKMYVTQLLPSEFDELEQFIIQNKNLLTKQVTDSIEHAIQNNLSVVEVFNFKDSDFIITLQSETFRDNLNNIYKYYIESEQYEKCKCVKDLELLLDNKNTNEKRQKPKGSPKRKNKRNTDNQQ